jgi:hypothetical protein
MIAREDLARLVKMLRLLGSESVGERAAAALKVHSFVVERGLDWKDLLQPEEALPAVTVSVAPDPAEFRPAYPSPAEAMAQHQAFLRAQAAAAAAEEERLRQGRAQAKAAGDAFLHSMRQAAAPPPFGAPHAFGRGVGTGQPGSVPPVSGPDAGRLGGCLGSWQDVAHALLNWHLGVLRGKEHEFIVDRLRYNGSGKPLSDRQEMWLRDIARRANLSWT